MKNITNIWAIVLLLFFTGFSAVSCSDDEAVVVPDNWVTVSTAPMTIDYEGGSLTCDYTLANGLDAGVVYIINHEDWCSGYIEDGKIKVDVALSEDPVVRTAKMSLIYDEGHQVELTVEQGEAPVVLVESIDNSAMPTSIVVGETLDLNTVVKVLPANASYKNLTFTLAEGSETFVELSPAGVVKGIAGGQAIINVATNDESGVTDVIALNVAVLFDRSSWTVKTSVIYANGNSYIPDGTTGMAEHMFDGNLNTFLSLRKPGKNVDGYDGGPVDRPVYFVVDMKTSQTFNYIVWGHRGNNSTDYLRVWGVTMFGSDDGENFTEIQSGIDLPYSSNSATFEVDVLESKYRYVKVQLVKWSDIAGGSTSGGALQIGEFNLGLK